MTQSQKPHVVCIPYPAQGHVNPMLKLAKLLHQKDFHITFVLTHYNANRLRKSRGPDALSGLPSFVFEFIPDGLPPVESEDATQDIPSLCQSTRKHCLAPFKEVLHKLNEQAKEGVNPPVSCIVSDGVMSFTLDAAEELGVPEVIFWTTSACGFLGYANYERLRKQGFTPLKDSSQLTNGYLDTIVDWLPDKDGIRLKDFPSFLRTTDPEDLMSEFVTTESIRAQRASAIILNTFTPLESEVLSALESHYLPPVLYVGPLHLMAIHDADTKVLGSNLWKEDAHCIEWLNTRPDESVVYINFGSITVMTADQLLEFAWGLANSKQSFLWVIRPDLVTGETAMLPAEFETATEGRGLMVDWCPQEEVLSHPAIGGFLTHCGWNSTIESIGAGVPMVCWPFFAEQQTNCRYVCGDWGIGMEIDNDVKREVVERQVRDLMVGENGKEMRRRAADWKSSAEASARVGSGSSYLSLDKLVEVLLVKKTKE